MALFVPDDDPLLFYRAIACWSKNHLTPKGKGMTEINELLGEETKNLFIGEGFSNTYTVKDFYDKERFVYYSR